MAIHEQGEMKSKGRTEGPQQTCTELPTSYLGTGKRDSMRPHCHIQAGRHPSDPILTH